MTDQVAVTAPGTANAGAAPPVVAKPVPAVAASPVNGAPAVKPPAEAKAGDETFLGDKGADADEGADKPPVGPGWRERMAGGDEKFLNHLKRYGTEADFGKSHRELEKKIGQVKRDLPDNPTPEQTAAWRKENGIPETHEGYEIKLPDGIKISETDQPVVNEFLRAMHGNNMTPASVNSALGWYMSLQEKAQVIEKEAENKHRTETIAALREELGPEYKATQGMIGAWLGRQEGDVGEMLMGARGEDGHALMNNKDFVLWLNNHIRQTEPSATVIHDTDMAGSSVDAELAKIQDVIRLDPSKYNNDPKMQERLLKLATAKEKMTG